MLIWKCEVDVGYVEARGEEGVRTIAPPLIGKVIKCYKITHV